MPFLSEFEVGVGAYRFDPAAEAPELPRPLVRAADDLGTSPRRRYIVQFTEPLGADDRRRLRQEYRLQLRTYIPNLAYIESLRPDEVRLLSADAIVRAVTPYEPAFKLAPHIGQVPTRTEERSAAPETSLDATLFEDSDPQRVIDQLAELGAGNVNVLDDRARGGRLRVRFTLMDLTRLEAIAHVEEIQWVEEISEIIEDDALAAGTIQSGRAQSWSIWDRGLHGEGQVIGVLDGGPLDIGHCFFEDPDDNRPRADHRKVRAIRNASGSNPGGHATFVSGCAAGDDFNDSGNAPRRGGAWAAQLVSGNRNDLANRTLLAELDAAADAGARIHTNSWHDNTAGAEQPAMYNQNAADVDAFMWNNEDHLVLGSAGNSGEEQGPPGTAKNAICVAAAQADPDEMSFGDGNPGPTADGRRKPDLVAVGCGIESALVDTRCGTGPRGACATSYATPHAAAAAALVRQYFTEGWYPSGRPVAASRRTPSGALIKAVLVNSTMDMTRVAGYPNDTEGWGLIRLDDVLVFPTATTSSRSGMSETPVGCRLVTGGSTASTSSLGLSRSRWRWPGRIRPGSRAPPTCP